MRLLQTTPVSTILPLTKAALWFPLALIDVIRDLEELKASDSLPAAQTHTSVR